MAATTTTTTTTATEVSDLHERFIAEVASLGKHFEFDNAAGCYNFREDSRECTGDWEEFCEMCLRDIYNAYRDWTLKS